MLKEFKELFTPSEILKGNFGIEREGLRVNYEGSLSKRQHPKAFGNKIKNPYITTDFSESQLELITPALNTSKEVHDFLESLYDIVALETDDEFIWPESMPCAIPDDMDIPVAEFCKCKKGAEARAYREELLRKYGGKIQLISGIHYNFSFSDEMLDKLYNNSNKEVDYKTFKDNIYLKVTRNYLRYRWLIIYLLGGTGVVHESFKQECINKLNIINEESYSCDGIVSYRNSDCGYGNKITLFANYDSTESYINSIVQFINDNVIQSPKEFYNSIRPKSKDPVNLLKSLHEDGIQYLEYRSIDINPFSKAGISLEDLEFLSLFNLFLLFKDESEYKEWQEDALENQKRISRKGGNNPLLLKDGKELLMKDWALKLLSEIQSINKELCLNKEDIINNMISRIKDYSLTYTSRFIEKVRNEGYVPAHLSLAKEYREEAYKNRFTFKGYEDLELSTQILMKEAVKSGIQVKILDRSENFIALSRDGKTEYIKQATKTSLDNYVSVLMMENKVITKNVIKKSDIRVPLGEEYHSINDAKLHLSNYINKPIVIKPKSTNFGIGISIFPTGGNIDDLSKALDIAFSKDNTVLIEEFINGKEYRFLVIGDKVSGILHRVPANVNGDGIHSIEELVNIKNKDTIRGKGYKTPLEKIELNENVLLFLKGQNIDIKYIPKLDEKIYLRENSNISTGGDSIDYTDDIPDKFKEIALKSSRAIGANICGVDMIIEDYSNVNSDYGIIELNFNPAIHIHSYPYIGTERNIAQDIIKLLGFNIQSCD